MNPDIVTFPDISPQWRRALTKASVSPTRSATDVTTAGLLPSQIVDILIENGRTNKLVDLLYSSQIDPASSEKIFRYLFAQADEELDHIPATAAVIHLNQSTRLALVSPAVPLSMARMFTRNTDPLTALSAATHPQMPVPESKKIVTRIWQMHDVADFAHPDLDVTSQHKWCTLFGILNLLARKDPSLVADAPFGSWFLKHDLPFADTHPDFESIVESIRAQKAPVWISELLAPGLSPARLTMSAMSKTARRPELTRHLESAIADRELSYLAVITSPIGSYITWDPPPPPDPQLEAHRRAIARNPRLSLDALRECLEDLSVQDHVFGEMLLERELLDAKDLAKLITIVKPSKVIQNRGFSNDVILNLATKPLTPDLWRQLLEHPVVTAETVAELPLSRAFEAPPHLIFQILNPILDSTLAAENFAFLAKDWRHSLQELVVVLTDNPKKIT